ncbi:hypothetical protein EVA_08353 [gut metagenome]|uniref:Uncharacterized protein n=1 Tax=gut metagenome TaxID=749906 RepID=J9GMS3_9ZZZZ
MRTEIWFGNAMKAYSKTQKTYLEMRETCKILRFPFLKAKIMQI